MSQIGFCMKHLMNHSSATNHALKFFTDKGKIARLESRSPHAVSSCSTSSHMSQLRNSTKPLLWELCMSCQTESKRETLRSVSTLETSTNIIEGAKFDQKRCPALSGCSDLIAAEAKYHLSCYTSFKSKNIQDKRYSTGDHHSNGMAGWLAEELALNAHNGHIVELAEVWKRYNRLTEEIGEDVPQSFISRITSFTDKSKSLLKYVYEFHVLQRDAELEKRTILVPVKFAHIPITHHMKSTKDDENEIQIPAYKPEDHIFFIIGACCHKTTDSLYMFLQILVVTVL